MFLSHVMPKDNREGTNRRMDSRNLRVEPSVRLSWKERPLHLSKWLFWQRYEIEITLQESRHGALWRPFLSHMAQCWIISGGKVKSHYLEPATGGILLRVLKGAGNKKTNNPALESNYVILKRTIP